MPYKDRGKWRAVVKIAGKRYTEAFPLTAEGRRDACSWEITERKRLTEKTQTAMVFSTVYNCYLDYAELRYSRTTHVEKKTLGKRFMNRVGNKLLEEITPKDLHDFLISSAESISNNKANRDRKNLMAFWRWTQKIYDIPNNPVAKIDRLPHDRAPQYTPPESDILKILAIATRRERAFLDCYLCTGARRGEIFRLKWDDVNFERREIRLGTRKSVVGSLIYEELPMNDQLHDSLMWVWKNRKCKDSPHVWVIEEGPYIGRTYTFRRRFLAGLCERAKVRTFGFHALRRYVASILADKHKISAKTIQRILRHKAIATTERYIHRINTDLAEVMGLLGESKVKDSPGTTERYHDESSN